MLGSTGSIGRQTLDVVRWHPETFEVVALVAKGLSPTLLEQIEEFHPRSVVSDGADGGRPGTELLGLARG